MRTMEAAGSTLLVIDVQGRLMPAIAGAAAMVAEVRRLIAAARLLEVPVLATEQNPAGLGPTLPGLLPEDVSVLEKSTFDACRAPGFAAALGPRPAVVVAGCEAHVCVLQTVLGLLDAGRRVAVVRDAVASRRDASRDAGLARVAAHGAELVTAEMVVFEWLGGAGHPRFREVLALVK